MIIDLSSPVEVRGYELLSDDSGVTRAYIDLFNVSDETVCGYTGTVRWMRDETRESASEYISVDEIEIPGGGEFRLMLSTTLLRYADRIEIYFGEVSFLGGGKWQPKDGELVDVDEYEPLDGSELDELKRIAGDDAIMYPETQDSFWRCVCGRINPLSEDECARCRRERNYVLTELNRKTVNLSDSEKQRREVRKSKSRRSSRRSADAKKNIKLYTALVIAASVVFLISCVIIIAAK